MATLVLDTTKGVMELELLEKTAPATCTRIKELASKQFYDGCRFHRVIEGFMAQTGCPVSKDLLNQKRWGTGGCGDNLVAEFNAVPFEAGSLGMARSQDPNSGSSQFFICFARAPHLDRQYTNFGQLVKGQDVLAQIKRGHPQSGLLSEPDVLNKAWIKE